MIYVFTNVEYPESRKIHPEREDLLVFLNKAATISYYRGHKKKMVIRRAEDPSYGEAVPGVRNMVVFGDEKSDRIPQGFIRKLKDTYDWNYPIEEGKCRCGPRHRPCRGVRTWRVPSLRTSSCARGSGRWNFSPRSRNSPARFSPRDGPLPDTLRPYIRWWRSGICPLR